MTTGIAQRPGAERGQTIAMFIVSLSMLMILLAFVVDVGLWLGTHRKLQSVADAAALAAVEKGQLDAAITDNGWATLSPDGSGLDPAAPPDSFTVTASRDAPIIFGGLAGIAGFSEKATATAEASPPSSLNNADWISGTGLPQPAPFITPLLVNENAFTAACSAGPCFGSTRTLSYDVTGDGSGDFTLANVCSSCPQPNGKTVRGWIRCSPCLRTAIDVDSTFAQIRNGPARRTEPALDDVASQQQQLIVPVFTGASPYRIVGFADFVLTSVDSWTDTSKVIEGYFTPLTLPGSVGAISGPGQNNNFGVRVVGLTS